MIRNIVLVVSTVAVLAGLLIGYELVVQAPADLGAGRSAVLPAAQPPPEQVLEIANTRLPEGGGIFYRRFDPRSGRPTDVIRCADWQPAAGSSDEVRLSKPELTILLPSGMVAVISAAVGQLRAERVAGAQARPTVGWIEGDARIVIDRGVDPGRADLAQRPEDQLVISTERLEFDLDRGELRTDGRLTVESADLRVVGAGLELLWNQVDNRVETMTLRRGEEFVLFAGGDLFGGAPESGAAAAGAAPAQTASQPARQARRRRGATEYLCTISGALVADQFVDDKRVGGLEADAIRMLIDIGGGEDGPRLARRDDAQTRPARDPRDRLVVRWGGELTLTSAAAPRGLPRPRRHFEATGDAVRLTRGDAAVICGRLEYFDETRQIWLHAGARGRVEMARGDRLAAAAQSVYVDRAHDLVKLVGDVRFSSLRGRGERVRTTTMQAAHWAELHLARETKPPTEEVALAGALSFDQIESAAFHGDVRVELEGQHLEAQRLDVSFAGRAQPAERDEDAELPLLDTATASGDVRMRDGEQSLECARLTLVFATTGDGDLYPEELHADGGVLMVQNDARVSGRNVDATLAPAPRDEPGGPEFALRTLRIDGQAAVVDRRNQVAARGEQISAAFDERSRLRHATVSGAADDPGYVSSAPYAVFGERIDLDQSNQTLRVDGPSRVSFETRRGFGGAQRARPTHVDVRAGELLYIDGKMNTVRFVGDVLAVSGDEQLRAYALTLLLEDVSEPPTPPRPANPYEDWLQRMHDALRQGRASLQPPAAGPSRAPAVADFERAGRKELIRLIAERALVQSETPDQPGRPPLMSFTLEAPTLESDVVNRQIATLGETTLLLTDRRGLADEETARARGGLPSALVTRGPSQTAMRCSESLTYVFGPEGPDRHDAAVLRGDVVFVHRAGREMYNLEQMIPDLEKDPGILDRLRSRNARMNCDRLEVEFAAGAAEPAGRTGSAELAAGAPEATADVLGGALRLSWMIATGNVYLRDQQEATIRSINAQRVEFSRVEQLVSVEGAPGVDARIYVENPQSGEFSTPHTGPRLTVDLANGTIRSGATQGELRRR